MLRPARVVIRSSTVAAAAVVTVAAAAAASTGEETPGGGRPRSSSPAASRSTDAPRPSPIPVASKPAATALPTAAGAPVAIVWHSGSTLFGSALDGSGARELLRVPKDRVVLPTPSPDGTRVALIAGDRLLVLDTAGGTLRDAGATASPSGPLRWSPDGSRVAAVAQERVVVCEAAGGCARWGDHVAEESGLSWSPESRAMVVIRHLRRRGDEEAVVSTIDRARTRVLDRLRPRRDRFAYPTPPIWTAKGPAWSLLDLRYEDGEVSGVDGTRVRQRRGGRTQTIANLPPTRTSAFPFTVAVEALDGTLLGSATTYRGSRPTSELRALTDAGRVRGTAIGIPGLDESDEDRLGVLGVLADGRVALATRRGTSRRAELRLATIGTGVGAVVRRAGEFGVATVHAGNPGAE